MSLVVERLEDGVYSHALDLTKVETGLRQRMLGHLKEMEVDLIDQLQSEFLTDFRRERLEGLLAQTRQTIDNAHVQIRSMMNGFVGDFARTEEAANIAILNQSVGVPLFSTAITPTQLAVITSNVAVQGGPLGEWLGASGRLSENTKKAFADQVRLGVSQGESIQDIVKRVRGESTGRRTSYRTASGQLRYRTEFQGGVLPIQTRQAKALVRTSVHEVANRVRDQVYENNNDIIKVIESVATLDSRTTQLCASYDGLRFYSVSKKPVNHKKKYLQVPRHWQCRSTFIPVLAELNELDRLAEEQGLELPEEVRASVDGPVPTATNMDTWLRGKNESFQRGIIKNQGKLNLWRSRKVSLKDLTDNDGQVLSLSQLQELAEQRSIESALPRVPRTRKRVQTPEIPDTQKPFVTSFDAHEGNVFGQIRSTIELGEQVARDRGTKEYLQKDFLEIGKNALEKFGKSKKSLKGLGLTASGSELISPIYKSILKNSKDLVQELDSDGLNDIKIMSKQFQKAQKDAKKIGPKLDKEIASGKITIGQAQEMAEAPKKAMAEARNHLSYLAEDIKRFLVSRSKVTATEVKAFLDNLEYDGMAESIQDLRGNLKEAFILGQGRGATSLKKLKYDRERAYATQAGDINVGSASRRTIFHEFAHHIEFESEEINKAALYFRDKKAKKLKSGDKDSRGLQERAPKRKLSSITGNKNYGASEVAYDDDYISAYVGKEYDTRNIYRTAQGAKTGVYTDLKIDSIAPTEVLSMGFEHFSNIEDMVELMLRDPEHFFFTLGSILR